jgi:outer membrane protein OmpA-like peptidoglycan-associated protein
MYKNILINLVWLILMPLGIWSQTQKAFLSEAEYAYGQKNYHGAMVYYNEALTFSPNDPVLRFKAAEAARQYGAYAYASAQYNYLMDSVKFDKHELSYRLGEVNQKMGNYQDALRYYEMYLSEYVDEDRELTGGARRGVSSVRKAMELVKTNDSAVTITRMGDQVNSPDADFGASDRAGTMYFSSLRFDGKTKATKYKQIAKNLQLKNDNVQVIDGYINDRDVSVANFAFNAKGDKVYYSLCEYNNGWTTLCKIYSSAVDGDGNLSVEQIMPDNINAIGSSNTQPNVGYSPDGKEVLYFVSDRSGGLGGRDIWSAPTDGGDATNLRTVNTTLDEITPFFHAATKTLYFSTEGRDGLGGFDVFKYTPSTKKVEILPPPTNSSRNDMYYYLNPEGTKGYLSSSRGTSLSQIDSYEACCMDIYTVEIAPDIDLDVLTLLQTDGSDLNGTKVCLFDKTTFTETCIDNPNSTNLAKFKLKANHTYVITATKDGYTTATEEFTTKLSDKKLVKKLSLMPPAIKLEARTFELPSRAKLDGATIKLIDVTDPSKPTEISKVNDRSNDFYFDVLPNRQYKLVASKNGYSTALDMINTKGLSGTLIRELFLQKNALQELLPISLYFDNDYPDPRSNSSRTKTLYNSVTDNYINRKGDYIKNFTKTLSDGERSAAQAEIESFFENDVEDGRYRFNAFLAQLEGRLSAGEKIELEIRGFASPRAKSDYNKILSDRRIDCIKNQMMAFGSGPIRTALQAGQLQLKDVSFGNATAKSNVVADLNDERNSIYNLNAARERRVEIINVNYK